MKIWVFNAPNDDAVSFVYESVKQGKSRFGWSYFASSNLNIAESRSWDEMTEDEATAYRKAAFLWQVEPGDWIVHVNVPSWGRCTAVRVATPYAFDPEVNNTGQDYTKTGDYRHVIGVDPASMVEFDRNDPRVHPAVSRRLKLQGGHWQIRLEDEFLATIENLRSKGPDGDDAFHELMYFRKEVDEHLKDITRTIQKNFPSKKLEGFIASIFRRVPGVLSVKENGSGWGTDHGADLIVSYEIGLPVAGLVTQQTLVVQVKSFIDVHSDLEAVEQIETAIKHYGAEMGLILTTGVPSNNLRAAVEELSRELELPVRILGGAEVAAFVMKYDSGALPDA